MLPASRFKIAFIGTHGVGKTTLCYGLAARLKRRDVGVEVVHEVARRCPLPINEETSVAAQSWILHTQIAEELVAQARYPVRSAAGRQEGPEGLVEYWIQGYDLLVHVPIVEQPSPDGVRSPDPGFQYAVEDKLRREIDERGLPTLFLDPAARPGWLDTVERTVWERLRPAQLPLPSL